MHTFENAVTIHRPTNDVFAFLADFENVPRWNYAIEETRQTSAGPVGVGSTFRQVRSIPRRSIEEFQVTAFEPARRLSIWGRIGPFNANVSYLLESTEDGTRLVNTVELDPANAALRLIAPLAAPGVKSAVAKNLDKLRQLLESSGSSS